MLNPCCCLSPRIGAFIFGVLDMIMAVTYALNVLTVILDGRANGEMIGEIVVCAVLLTLACFLLLGAWRNDAEKIRLWLWSWIIFIIVVVVLQALNVWSQHHINVRTGSSVGGFLLMLYQIWVVYAYLMELRGAALEYCPTQIKV